MTDWNAGARSARLPALRVLAGACVAAGLAALLVGTGHQAAGIALVAAGAVLAAAAEVVHAVAERPRH